MTDAELYKLIQNTQYINAGLDVDYQFVTIDNVLYLLFQESRSQQDWKINFDFPCRLYKKYLVHRGYVKAWLSVKDEIMTKLKELMNCQIFDNFIICGWSYGASLSVLAGEEYHYQFGRKPVVKTFGGARIVYSLGTKHKLNKTINITEYVQKNDFVTWVNPFCFRLHKKTVGEKFSIKKLLNTTYYHCNYDRFIN